MNFLTLTVKCYHFPKHRITVKHWITDTNGITDKHWNTESDSVYQCLSVIRPTDTHRFTVKHDFCDEYFDEEEYSLPVRHRLHTVRRTVAQQPIYIPDTNLHNWGLRSIQFYFHASATWSIACRSRQQSRDDATRDFLNRSEIKLVQMCRMPAYPSVAGLKKPHIAVVRSTWNRHLLRRDVERFSSNTDLLHYWLDPLLINPLLISPTYD